MRIFQLSLWTRPDWLDPKVERFFPLNCMNLRKSLLICVLAIVLQAKAYQLLMTYSALYVKLLMSRRLTGPSHHCLRPRRNHCSTAPFCLCQYIRKKILQ